MPTTTAGMLWFKNNFGDAVRAGLDGTPYSLDLLTAIAVQETFEVWGSLFSTMQPSEVLKVCVGDTLDAPNRGAFPRNRAELESMPNGADMFRVARQALEDVGQHNAVYHKVAAANPDKFSHGFGIFQYDIQFCQTDPNFFLDQQWFDFSACLDHAVKELDAARTHAYGPAKKTLTDTEMVYVAIAYNQGHVDTSKDFRQGFLDPSGKFYGQLIDDYMTTSESISVSMN